MRDIKLLFKTGILLSILFFTSTVLFAENSQFLTIQKDSINNSNAVCYEVFGMDCPGCQSALEKQIKKIEGVAEAKASYKKKEVIITLKPDANVTEDEIYKRIKKANFTPGKKIETKEHEE